MNSARLIGHPGGVDLGPADPHEWLCGFLYSAPSKMQQDELLPLAGRIAEREPAALGFLAPDQGIEDWPAAIRHADGIVLHQLGRHSAAAQWAVRQAVARGWQRNKDVPSRSLRKKETEKLRHAMASSLRQLRLMSPHTLMALQQSMPDDRLFTHEIPRKGASGGGLVSRLPARVDLDGKGALEQMLESLIRAADADLERLQALGVAYRWPDWAAGSAENQHVTLAHEAVPLWLHFRPEKKPTQAIARADTFSEFAGVMHEIATGDFNRDMKRDVPAALAYYNESIVNRYG
jgi:hypothetical protein